MDGTRRRIAFGAIGAVVAVALVGVAINNNEGPSRGHVAPVASSGSTTLPPRPPTTTTIAVGTTMDPTVIAAPSAIGPADNPDPAATTLDSEATTTTTTAPSPWPPGTILQPRNLTGSTTFDPPEAHFDQPMAYTATITNPNDQWIFYDFLSPGRISYIGLEVGWNANGLFIIARPDDAVLRHETTQGPRTGLLLAPHASLTFAGQIQGYDNLGYDDPGPSDTRYFPVSIVFKDECCIGYAGIPAGSLPIPVESGTSVPEQ